MDFFQHQHIARRNTKWLVVFLLLAVLGLILLTTVAFSVVYYFFQLRSDTAISAYDQSGNFFSVALQSLSFEVLAYITLGVGLVVSAGSIYKLIQLSGGGKRIAESMGGRLLNHNTRDRAEKRILNVVEEIAIASGTPVPPVYIIDEDGINAFAAGFKAQDAVIGITRGCIQLLSREELQGVIAHEFSHILHGDMRLNIRLIGLLHGILVIGLIGYFITRSAAHSGLARRSRDNNPVAILGFGIALIVIGYAGTFFGNVIKAAVSRQREFLADASAVQFTRNPDGIGGALQKIGGYSAGSRLHNPHAAEYSHLYFSQGIATHLNGLMATHPPLSDRIKRVNPQWDGKFPVVTHVQEKEEGVGLDSTSDNEKSQNAKSKTDPLDILNVGQGNDEKGNIAGKITTAVIAAGVLGSSNTTGNGSSDKKIANTSAIDSIGQPTVAHVTHAQELLRSIPEEINQATHDSFSARAIIYSILLNKQLSKPEVLNSQLALLQDKAHPIVYKFTEQFQPVIHNLDTVLFLPLIELCMPALKTLSEPQHQVFKRNLIALIKADNKVDLFEWAIYRILIHNLEDQLNTKNNKKISQLNLECHLLLSLVAHAGHDVSDEAEAAYTSAMSSLGIEEFSVAEQNNVSLRELDRALNSLSNLKPLEKPSLLKAVALCISHDEKITATEAELFRAIADSLDCPVPPLLANQTLSD
ncbi:MAG: M48 family metallopeptidase [Cellvibrionaceae bacterium]